MPRSKTKTETETETETELFYTHEIQQQHVVTLYQDKATTDKKPTIGYYIWDNISTRYSTLG